MEGDWGERVGIGGIQKHRLLQQGLPTLFPAFALLSLPSPPYLFASATQADTSFGKYNPTS